MAMTSPGPEARLLLALARATLDDDRRSAARALVDDGPLDWEMWLGMVERHGLAPLAHRHLESLGAAIPRNARARLWARAEATAQRNAALCRELAVVVGALHAHGIDVVPYKGPTLALRAYGDVALREFGDLDLLVRPRDALRAKAILQERGYVAKQPLPPDLEKMLIGSSRDYELGLVDRARGTMVELHWRADPDAQVPAVGDDAWWRALPRIDACGCDCAALPIEDLLLVLCLHGAKHFWWSLGWLVDVVELAGREPVDWRRIHESARRHGGARRMAFTALLARDLLGADLGPTDGLPMENAAVHAAARFIRGRILSREDPELTPLHAFRLNASLCDGPVAVAALAWKAAFTPGWGDWLRWRLPRPLFFLYPFLRASRLFAKYALRLGAREAELPPRLEHRDGDRVGQVEAAVPGTHRKA